MDFEERHRRQAQHMAFCGYKEALTFRGAVQDVLAILAEAVPRAADDDLRGDAALQSALDYLDRKTPESALVARFRRSLDLTDPKERQFHVTEIGRELYRRARRLSRQIG